MSAQQQRRGAAQQQRRGALRKSEPSYYVTLTDTGKWLHAPGSDFLFAYLENNWPPDVLKSVTTAFETALGMSSVIKVAVKETSGQDVVNGLYLLDQAAMTKAMNSIDGMGQTSVDQSGESGSGTAVSINQEFFAAILGGLGGDVEPLMTYLTAEMGDVQAQTKESTVTDQFGTLVGLISVMPVLNVSVTSFQYVYSSSSTSEWFVSVNCGSTEHYSYDYKYTVVEYNYSKPES
jgi:hypothetical protein